MSGHQEALIGDTVYFWFGANDTSGSGGDGATPAFDVRVGGAVDSAIPLLSGIPSLLTHALYPAGCHEVAFAASVANGFAANDTFAVFATLAIDAQNPTGFIGSCTLRPAAKHPQTGVALNTIPFSLKDVNGNYVTGATGVVVTRSIDGVSFAAVSGTTTTEVGNGLYELSASAADMSGGKITFRITASGGTPSAPVAKLISIITDTGT